MSQHPSPTRLPDTAGPTHPRVFVSYAWEGASHRTWVRRLAEDLVSSGVQVRLDQWLVKTGESFTKFMESEVSEADYVILVCTPTYATKSNSREGGVGYEQQIISGKLVQGVERHRFLPLVRAGSFKPGPDHAIPTHFLGIAALDFRDDSTYPEKLEELLRVIYAEPLFRPPKLGTRPALPASTDRLNRPADVQTEPTGTPVTEDTGKAPDRPAWRSSKTVLPGVLAVAVIATAMLLPRLTNEEGGSADRYAEGPPFVVPPTPRTNKVMVRHEFDNPTYESFDLHSDRKVIDFRLWKRLSEDETTKRSSPVTWTRTVSGTKIDQADAIRFQFSTTGLGIDFRCREVSCVIEERAPEPTGDRTRIQKTYHVVADVSEVGVGEEFKVIIEATFWNAFQGDENAYVTMRSHAPLELMSLTLVFRLIDGKPAFTAHELEVAPYDRDRGEKRKWDESEGIHLVDSTGSQVYWEIRSPVVGDIYMMSWQWLGI